MSKGHVLVTGGAGFIGSHLVDTLLSRGFQVSVLDCLLPQVHSEPGLDGDGWPRHLDRRARRIKGNILDKGVFERSLAGVTHLVHLAASVGFGQSMMNIVGYTENNTMAAAVMLEALSRGNHKVRRIAVASSMAIYGEGAYCLPSTGASIYPDLRSHEQLEEHQWDIKHNSETLIPIPTSEATLPQPASIYAINKRDHEDMFLTVGRALHIPTVALRIFNAYGPRQTISNPYSGVATLFISRLLNNQPPLIFEDGEQMRDFVHVLDVADAFAAVLESDKVVWQACNVGSGNAVTVKELADTLARLLRKNIAPRVLDQYRIGDIRHCFADISKLRNLFGFTPKRDFEQGMSELVRWIREGRKTSARPTATWHSPASDSLHEFQAGRIS